MIGGLDAKINYTKAPFTQYNPFLLDKNFRHYIETIMILWQKISRALNLKILQRPKKHSLDNLTQKHLLYKQFVAWSCDEWSVASLTD